MFRRIRVWPRKNRELYLSRTVIADLLDSRLLSLYVGYLCLKAEERLSE